MNNLLVRTISGIGIILVVLGSILISEYTFLALTLIIFSIGFYEFRNMFELKDRSIFYSFLVIGITGLVMVFLHLTNSAVPNLGIAIAMAIIAVLIYFLMQVTVSIKEIAYSIFGVLWIAGSLTFFLALGWNNPEKSYYALLILILQVLLWVNDIAAFLIGSYFGKRLLAPSISPGKTWEGFISGVVFNALAGYVIYKIIGDHTAVFWIFAAVLISLGATAGDLLESKIKREAGSKDSGTLIPGHGGILDRFDSLLFTAPLFYILFIIG